MTPIHNRTTKLSAATPQEAISCEDFQDRLPDLFASSTNGVSEDPILLAHLNSCDNCSALVRDLQYIAAQARMLLEPSDEEPSPAVWSNIQSRLKESSSDDDLEDPPHVV